MTTREALIQARAEARKARRKQVLRSAGLFVLAPTLATAAYLLVIAPPGYETTASFTIRGSESGKADLLGIVGIAAPTDASRDAGLVAEYIRSPAMVATLRKQGLLKKAYARFSLDPFSYLSPKAPVEQATDFWQHKVKVITSTGGGTTVTVQAYTPEDSLALTRAVLESSEGVVNSLSQRPLSNVEKISAAEVERTRVDYEGAKARWAQFQAVSRPVPLAAAAAEGVKAVGGLEDEMAKARVQLAEAEQTFQPNSPQLQALRRKVGALENERQRAMARALGAPGAAPASAEVQAHATQLEYEFAAKAYYAALQSLGQSRKQTQTDEKYVVSYVQPQLPERSNYFRRLANVLAVLVGVSVLWGIGGLSYSVLKDHMR